MTESYRELYQEIIIDHNKHPRHHYEMLAPTQKAEGFNPLCGDKLTVYLKIENDTILDISFVGCGCAISQASASLMTEAVLNHSTEEAKQLFNAMHNMIVNEGSASALPQKLQLLSGVKAYPARVKCATLAWHTLDAALNQQHESVSTE